MGAERARCFEVVLAVTRLSLAPRRGDFGAVLERVQALLGPAEADTLSEVGLSNEARAKALMNLGIVELWAQLDDARRHLERGLELARRSTRVRRGRVPRATSRGRRVALFARVRERCAQAIATAEAQGLSTQPILCVALAMLGLMDGASPLRGGARLARARRALLRPDLEPATALLVQRARGMLALGQGRLGRALAAFRAAEGCRACS